MSFPYPYFHYFACVDRCKAGHYDPATLTDCIFRCLAGDVDTNPPPTKIVELPNINDAEFARMSKCLTLCSGACAIATILMGGLVVAIPGVGVFLVPAGVEAAEFCLMTCLAFCMGETALLKPKT